MVSPGEKGTDAYSGAHHHSRASMPPHASVGSPGSTIHTPGYMAISATRLIDAGRYGSHCQVRRTAAA